MGKELEREKMVIFKQQDEEIRKFEVTRQGGKERRV